MSSSLALECNELKQRYDSCFLKWYSDKYLRGESTTDECQSLFQKYKICLDVCKHTWCTTLTMRADLLQKALKERNIDSMLEDARNDNKDIEDEHLQR